MTTDAEKLHVLREIAAGFDKHDLGRIMAHFTDDCVFEAPRGPEAYVRRVEGSDAVRAAFADRFAGIPGVRYTDDTHFVADDRGVSEWLLSGTTVDGERIEVRGCDIWTFRGDKVARKDSFWKIRTAGQESRPPESWIQPHNVASRRVAEKCGFAFDRIDGVYQVYRLD